MLPWFSARFALVGIAALIDTRKMDGFGLIFLRVSRIVLVDERESAIPRLALAAFVRVDSSMRAPPKGS